MSDSADLPPPEVAFRSERDVARGLTAAYVLGLALIAILAIVSHFILNNIIFDQRDAATVINVAARQRMLTEQIGLLATDLHAGDETARAPLLEAAALMRRSEDALVHAGDLGISHILQLGQRQYYYDGTAALDPAIRTFLDVVQRYVKPSSAEDGEAAYRSLQTSVRIMLPPALDHAVSLFEDEANRRVDWLRTVQAIVLAVLLVTLALEGLFIFRPLVRKVQAHAKHLYDIATSDELTGLANRRHFMDNAQRAWLLARRNKEPFSAFIVDIDHFRRVNDFGGHEIGDQVLRRFAEIATDTLRSSDLMGRIGGEEFALVLPDMETAGAALVAEKLRQAVAGERSETLPRMTVSVGVSTAMPEDKSVEDVLRRADVALHEAKRAGRNRVAS